METHVDKERLIQLRKEGAWVSRSWRERSHRDAVRQRPVHHRPPAVLRLRVGAELDRDRQPRARISSSSPARSSHPGHTGRTKGRR